MEFSRPTEGGDTAREVQQRTLEQSPSVLNFNVTTPEVIGIVAAAGSALQHELPQPVPPEGVAGEVATPAEAGTADKRRRTPHDVLSPLPLAEEMDVAVLRQNAKKIARLTGADTSLKLASVLSEIGLASPSDIEAQAVFDAADLLYEHARQQYDPASETGMRAARAAAYMPVWRMRRADAEPQAMAPVIQRAIAESLSRVLPRVEGNNLERDKGGFAMGLFSEDCVAGLLAHNGRLPFISSYREGQSIPALERHTGLRPPKQASDFHLLDADGKVRIEVKTGQLWQKEKYDVANILVVSFLFDVCHPLVAESFVSQKWSTADEVMLRLAQLLRREGFGAGESPDRYERYLLDRGADLVEEKINAWKRTYRWP